MENWGYEYIIRYLNKAGKERIRRTENARLAFDLACKYGVNVEVYQLVADDMVIHSNYIGRFEFERM